MKVLAFFKGGSDKDRFAKLVIAHFRANGWNDELIYDQATFALNLGNENKGFLHNHYSGWLKADKGARTQLLDRILSLAFEVKENENRLDDFEAIKHRILPAFRNRAYIENMWMQEGFGDGLVYTKNSSRPFCDGLSLIITVDGNLGITACNDANFSKWGRSFDEVFPLALENLRAQKQVIFKLHDEGFYIAEDDDYDCALPLIPNAFKALELEGNPVAIVVARNLVLVADSTNQAGLEAMAGFAWEAYGRDSRPISLYPLILKDGVWSLFYPTENGSVFLPHLIKQQSLSDYVDQHETLTSYNERSGRDIFAANLLIKESETSAEKQTLAVLAYGVKALIPQADGLVIESAKDGLRIIRSWEDVMSVCGPKVIEPNTYPALYLFDRGVSDEEFQQLSEQYQKPKIFHDLN